MDIVTKMEDITLLSVVMIMGTAVNPHAETETTPVDTVVMTASMMTTATYVSKFMPIFHPDDLNCMWLIFVAGFTKSTKV